MAPNGLCCADVPLRNYSLTASLCWFTDAPAEPKKKKWGISWGKHHHEEPDDSHAEHTWHDHHPGAFSRMSKKHNEGIRRRMSSVGEIVEEPKGLSTWTVGRSVYTFLMP